MIGASIPTSWDLARKREYRATPSQPVHNYSSAHILFQLEPGLEILKPASPYAWVMDLITVIHDNEELEPSGDGGKGGLRFGAEGANGLSIDFNTGIASIKSICTTTAKGKDVLGEKDSLHEKHEDGHLYQEISPQHPAWATNMRIERFEVFDLGGPVSEPTTVEREEAADRKRQQAAELAAMQLKFDIRKDLGLFQESTPPLVGETELKRRIEGFGSGGA